MTSEFPFKEEKEKEQSHSWGTFLRGEEKNEEVTTGFRFLEEKKRKELY
jgi:hypothetical protein